MEITDQQFAEAEARGAALREKGHATAAQYDQKANRLIVSLHNGVELTVPVHLIQDLADATPSQLSNIVVTPSGLGLHWPDIDADVYVPGILAGTFGTKAWMASVMGEKGGKSKSLAKATAARNNGCKGGRPMSKPMTIEEFQKAEMQLINKKRSLSKYASGARNEVDNDLIKLKEKFRKSLQNN